MEFERAYKQLNEAQCRAVNAIQGPVLVVAGPGTGKTQLLSVRVANVLKKTDAAPSNILCLTFTNKAAVNMRERLLALIGPDARNITVRTFHSFAAEIMNAYPDYFWNGARLSVAPDAVQLEIIRDILSNLPLASPLAMKFAGAYTALADVQQALKLTKEAGLTPEKLRALIDVNLAYIDLIEPQLGELLSPALSAKKLPALLESIETLPDQLIDESTMPLISLSTLLKESLAQAVALDAHTGKTKHTGNWKRRFVQTVDGRKGLFDERKRNRWWREAADVYEAYRDALHGRGYYDYSDMIIEVISQLERAPEMRADVQERYQYVLIDEFQDTNAAQLRLAHLVADHHLANGRPNLMAVGDDDQSIFAFNGAELSNMLSFRRTYPATQVIVLEDNYRSSQAILDTAKAIIEQAEDRLVMRDPNLTKNLRAVNPPAGKGSIEHLSFPTRDHQLSMIADRVAHAWHEDGSTAVLARSHDSLRRLARVLLEHKVPVRYEQQRDILENEAVQQVILMGAVVEDIYRGNRRSVNQGLSRLLRHPMWDLKPAVLWQLALANYSQPDWLGSLLEHLDERLQAIGNWLVWLSREAANQPLPLVLEYIIGLREGQYFTSPFRSYFLSRNELDSRYLEALSATELLIDLAAEFNSKGSPMLADFVRFISLNRDLGRGITDESWFMSDERAVQLLTVHKAKGLEFDTVFVLDAIEDQWSPRTAGRKPPANLPLQPYGDTYDDYVRLLYVAATRAKRSLLIGSYYTDARGKELLPSPIAQLALPPTIVTATVAPEPVPVLETALRWPRLETHDERVLLSGRLDDFCLSATALIDFLNVATAGPAAYFERHVLRLPGAKGPQQAYGTAIHAALETAQRLTNSGHFTLDTVIDRYESALRAESLPPGDFERYLPHGESILRQLFEQQGYRLPKGSLAEREIADVQLGAARLGGTLDRLDKPEPGRLVIVDYKTGTPLQSFFTQDHTKAIKAWKQRTQLGFYGLLVDSSRRYGTNLSIDTAITYVEAEAAKDITRFYTPSADDQERLRRLIEIVWRHTMQLEFPDTSRYTPDYPGILQFEDDLLGGRL